LAFSCKSEGFEPFTAIIVKSCVFWSATPCSQPTPQRNTSPTSSVSNTKLSKNLEPSMKQQVTILSLSVCESSCRQWSRYNWLPRMRLDSLRSVGLACNLLIPFLFRLSFDPNDRSDIFFRNIGLQHTTQKIVFLITNM
jgi:hypothetical protein